MTPSRFHVCVVGGGVAAVSAVRAITATWDGGSTASKTTILVTIISTSPNLVEAVEEHHQRHDDDGDDDASKHVSKASTGRTGMLAQLHVQNVKDIASITANHDVQVNVKCASVHTCTLEGNEHVYRLTLDDASIIDAHAVIACSGARAVVPTKHDTAGVSVRDAADVQRLIGELHGARRVAVVGNGAIALEMCHHVLEKTDAEVAWCCRDATPGDAYFDVDASNFVLSRLLRDDNATKRPRTSRTSSARTEVSSKTTGLSAGPNWLAQLDAAVAEREHTSTPANRRRERLKLYPNVLADESLPAEMLPPMARLATQPYRYGVHLSPPDEWIGADTVIVCCGVAPATGWVASKAARAADGGLLVDAHMRCANMPMLYAAGDTATLPYDEERPHFFQQRTWAQARLTGWTAGLTCVRDLARWMSNAPPPSPPAAVDEEVHVPVGLELFVHTTSFAGQPVVMLGRHDGRHLDRCDTDSLQTLVSEQHDPPRFVRATLHDGKLIGACLIGMEAVSLAETFENLILSELNVGHVGAALVDGSEDIEDYFD